MKLTFTIKGLERPLLRSLAVSCLLAGAGSLGATGCGGSSTTPPTSIMMPPGTVPTPTTMPTPYSPAYPPVAPQVQKGTGGVLSAPHVIPLFFSGDKFQTQLYSFVQGYMTKSVSWQVLKEYGIGFGTVAPVTVLQQTLAASMTDKDVQTFLLARVQDGSVVPDAQTVVVLYFPSSVVITNNGEVSCQDFAGYHGTALQANGSQLAYAVIPRCAAEPLSALTFATSHELAEAATDPNITSYNDLNDPYSLWQLNLGGSEVGDLCQNLADAAVNELGVGIVARVWSNATMAAFGNPCQPQAPGPAFFSFPMHTQLQTVQLNTTLRKVEQIPVAAGQTVTVDVRMLSTTKPSPTWNVTPQEVPFPTATGPGTAALSFAWQEAPGLQTAAGVDGITLHLKITAKASGPLGYTTFRLVSIGPTTAGGKAETDWVGVVLVTK